MAFGIETAAKKAAEDLDKTVDEAIPQLVAQLKVAFEQVLASHKVTITFERKQQ